MTDDTVEAEVRALQDDVRELNARLARIEDVLGTLVEQRREPPDTRGRGSEHPGLLDDR